jgi:hypothetical protein
MDFMDSMDKGEDGKLMLLPIVPSKVILTRLLAELNVLIQVHPSLTINLSIVCP